MNTLNSLKLVSFAAVRTASNPQTVRRSKLADKISEQIAAAKAASEGAVYTRSDSKRRVRQWFYAIDDKKTCVVLMHGSKQLELTKGKNAVECMGLQGVIGTLETLRTAVLAGELDSQIAAAAAALKRGFEKK